MLSGQWSGFLIDYLSPLRNGLLVPDGVISLLEGIEEEDIVGVCDLWLDSNGAWN